MQVVRLHSVLLGQHYQLVYSSEGKPSTINFLIVLFIQLVVIINCLCLQAMHPEAQPQKLAPTNRTPRTGKKLKRKLDIMDSTTGPLIFRAITYSTNAQAQSVPASLVHQSHIASVNEAEEELFDETENSLTGQTGKH